MAAVLPEIASIETRCLPVCGFQKATGSWLQPAQTFAEIFREDLLRRLFDLLK